ncbi:hypothetical protein FSARC_6418 [Fusarium sarcochroum]|uniref:Enoyl reductase (ER) domain-containing protein n=1 Tax=Fusarium sarcochroum TaxID=1208366 RepID=A0A8H4X928_9HYPO|nr:hypothetical protein FSARC_6418 [Fusarium sarcochroum]
MSTQAGITIDGPNKPYKIVDNISRPTPGSKQVLVKCLGVGINPVEPMQQQSGLLVNEWPAIIGSDCAGVVIDVGPDTTKLKSGDYIYGCAPLGQNRFTPFQDTFLVQEDVFLKKSSNLSVEDSCTIGVGLLTSSLCLLAGAKLKLPKEGAKADQKEEWVVVLGGTGTVGQYAVQLANVCGYKVLTSCSPSKQSVATQNGASATFNNRGSVDEQVAEIKKITGGNFGRIMDATAYGYEVMVKALENGSDAKTKYLTTVDDWSEFSTPSSINEYRAELGHLCRLDEPDGAQVTSDISGWIPALEAHLAAGTLKPLEYQVIDGVGWDKVIQGINDLEGGKAAKKIVQLSTFSFLTFSTFKLNTWHSHRLYARLAMEAIGAGASTLAFVLLALKSAKVIHESLSSIKGAPKTVRELVEDIKFLQSVLGRMSHCPLQNAPTSTIDSLNETLQHCTVDLSSIESRLTKFSPNSLNSRSSRLWKGVLAYVKKEDLENARSRIRDKSTQMNLYLGLIQAQSISDTSSRIDTQAAATTNILQQILGEISKLHERLDQDVAPIAPQDDVDATITGHFGTLTVCSELEASISRLSSLVDHDGSTLDADDAEHIVDDLRRFVTIAKEKSSSKTNNNQQTHAYNTAVDKRAIMLRRDLKLIEGLILSAPIIAINKPVISSNKLLSCMPRGTIIKQKRLREEIDANHGYLTISTNKRRRVCQGVTSNSSGNATTFRDVVASIVFRPSNFPWMLSVSLSQGQLFDRSVQSIPRISVCPIVPNDSPVFTLVKQGQLKEFTALLTEGKASLRDHDEQGMPLLHYAATASVEMCKFLIESGADVDEMGEHTGTALSRISGLDRHDTTLVLLQNMADPTLSYPGWDNPLSTACNLDLPSAELFLKHGGHFTMHDLESSDLNGRTRLHQICMTDTRSTSKRKAVAMLVAAGASLSARVTKSWSPDDHQTLGFTCLHGLVYKAHRSKDRDDLETLVLLIQQGADVFALDHHQHSVFMRAYLSNDSDNQYSSKGSYRGDLWDAALTICGYDIGQHRDAFPRVPRYNKSYRRKDFERLWLGHESSCPYWNDERHPETGGTDDYWKQTPARCNHIACSDCEDPPTATETVESNLPLLHEADLPGYAQDMYHEWAYSPSDSAYGYAHTYTQEDQEVDLESLDWNGDDPDALALDILDSEIDDQLKGYLSLPASEDGEAAFHRLAGTQSEEDEDEEALQGLVTESESDDYPAFVNKWLDYYIEEAERE